MQRSIPFLWALVIILLVLNLLVLDALNLARLSAIESLGKIEAMLDRLANEVIVYNVKVDQAVPMQADIPFNRTMDIPLKTVIPIDQTLRVPFQTLAGEIMIEVPVKTDVPIDMVVPVNFDQTISVDTVVQLKTTLPVEIEIAQTPLAGYLKEAKSDIARLRNLLMLRRGAATEEMLSPTTSPPQPSGDTGPSEPGASPAQSRSAESQAAAAITQPASDVSQALQPQAVASILSADQSRLGQCAHPYWPLQRGAVWTYNSPHSSYAQRADDVLNDEAYLSTQYEGRDIQFSLACLPEGLGGTYLGDARRITELGNLNFSNPRGMFLPRPEAMEQLGIPWRQELDVTGAVPAKQGDRPVQGRINRGRAVATYTPIRIETVETPLGPREALRVEQKLDLTLELGFDLEGETVPANETINLSNVYWFVKGMGLVRAHWQGGTLRYDAQMSAARVSQELPVPTLAEDQLVIVCITLPDQSVKCMQRVGISESDLTPPPTSELEVPSPVFPEPAARAASPSPTPASPGPTPIESGGDDGRLSLLEYATAVERLIDQLSDAAEAFGEAALGFRDGQVTFDQFQAAFSEFAPQVRRLIQELNRLAPPRQAEAVHQKLVGGMNKCNQAVDLMETWFQNPDSSIKQAGSLLVADCVEDVTAAEEELAALTGQGSSR